MRRLLIIRHSKSSWKFPELDDHDRPLNPRGKRDKELIAQFLVEKESGIDCVYSSTAARARGLAETISMAMGKELVLLRELYTFSASDLLGAIRNISNRESQIAVVSHNPAITYVVNELVAPELSNVPTSGVVAIDCEIDKWSDLCSETCRLDYFIKPKLLS